MYLNTIFLPPFPSQQAQMSSFKKWRGQEVPVKRRDMDTLADLHSKLQQESQKKKRKSPRSPTIPPELAYPPLEMVRRYLYSCKPSPKGKMLF